MTIYYIKADYCLFLAPEGTERVVLSVIKRIWNNRTLPVLESPDWFKTVEINTLESLEDIDRLSDVACAVIVLNIFNYETGHCFKLVKELSENKIFVSTFLLNSLHSIQTNPLVQNQWYKELKAICPLCVPWPSELLTLEKKQYLELDTKLQHQSLSVSIIETATLICSITRPFLLSTFIGVDAADFIDCFSKMGENWGQVTAGYIVARKEHLANVFRDRINIFFPEDTPDYAKPRVFWMVLSGQEPDMETFDDIAKVVHDVCSEEAQIICGDNFYMSGADLYSATYLFR